MTDIVVFKPSDEQQKEALKISEGWKGFGNKLALMKFELIFKAQNLKPTLPTKIEDIPTYDQTLTDLKRDWQNLVILRKTITKKLDEVAGVLMLPEKEVEAHIKQFESALLPLKQTKRNNDNAAAARAQELQRFRENAQIQYNEMCAMADKTIQRVKGEKFEFALENVHVVDIEKYKTRLRSEMTAASFTPVKLTDADPEKQKIIDEIFTPFNPAVYVQKYSSELDQLFVDFATAKQNKTDALLQQQTRTEAAVSDISATTTMNNVAASLDAAAQVAPAVVYTKGLKQVYVVEMEHNEMNMVNIMRAFVGNLVQAMPQLRVSDCFNITITQMASALAALKNLDDNFKPDKIIFKLDDKLR